MSGEAEVAVVGAGPNGLAAAVTMARAGLSVELIEGADDIGGGARTAELTLPGYRHDVCSAVHPMALGSPFFRDFELEERIDFVIPDVSYAQPLDGGRAGIAFHDLDRTVEALGRDGKAWRGLFGPLVEQIDQLTEFTGDNLLKVPHHLATIAKYGMRVLEQGSPLWNARFRNEVAPAMIAGVSAHSIGRMPRLATAGAGLLLGAHAHARGWPVPLGGSQSITDSMAADLVAHGGTITTGRTIASIAELGDRRAVILDVSARALGRIAGDQLPAGYRRALERFRYGDAVAKVDFALSAPVPWANADAARAGTLHLGGTRAALARSEGQVAAGVVPDDPFVLIAQPSVYDPSRAPAGKHVLWAYAHVPRNSTVDMTEAIIRQIERFAPGFRDIIEASAARSAADLSNYNPNYVGGDISAGAVSVFQLLKRPVISTDPWRTPAKGIYLASSSSPPGPSVHGMCGWYAARSALRSEFGIQNMPSLSVDS